MWSRHDQHHLGPRLWRLCAMGLIATWLVACWPHKVEPSTPEPTGQRLEVLGHMRDHGLPYHRNPQPRQSWRVLIEIEGAPGPLVPLRSSNYMQLQLPHPCLPPVRLTLMGVPDKAHPSASVEFPLERAGENRFTGVFHTDVLLDEDYFGLGVCPWELVSGNVAFSATGSAGETRYGVSYMQKDLAAGFEKKLYFTKRAYPRSPLLDNASATGYTDPNRFRPELRDELFTITLRIEEISP